MKKKKRNYELQNYELEQVVGGGLEAVAEIDAELAKDRADLAALKEGLGVFEQAIKNISLDEIGSLTLAVKANVLRLKIFNLENSINKKMCKRDEIFAALKASL